MRRSIVRTVQSARATRATLESALDYRFEIRCRGCGYGGVVTRAPNRRPMCGAHEWLTLTSKPGLPTSTDRVVDAPNMPVDDARKEAYEG